MRITRLVRMPWPLFAVLAVQAALSASMVRARTAFGDEALYLSAGHLQWSHWLHGAQIPRYQTWFSGAPVIYPPIGAIADSLGGPAAARLLAVLALSALLAPADQARIQTTTSLNKHVDFGAWFAAIAAGTAQADAMIDWPDVTGLVKVVRPMAGHGGHFLVETTDVLLYYLPRTTWRQWSNTQDDNLEYYQRALARHYFSVVILSFN